MTCHQVSIDWWSVVQSPHPLRSLPHAEIGVALAAEKDGRTEGWSLGLGEQELQLYWKHRVHEPQTFARMLIESMDVDIRPLIDQLAAVHLSDLSEDRVVLVLNSNR